MWFARALAISSFLIPLSVSLGADDGVPHGLEKRIPWNDSRVAGSPDPMPPYKVVKAFPDLKVKQPLALRPEPGTNRLFILQHLGTWAGPSRLLTTNDDQKANSTEELLELDGLAIGFTFHPDYEKNGYVYVGMNGPMRGRPKTTQVVRYTVDRKPPHGIDPASKLLIIEWKSNGHDGGDLDFGNDGYLYVSSGDGSSDSDGHLTGQTIDDLLAAVLRIDVDHPDPGKNYSVPKDNPFVDRPNARPELWAYGLRNPWRLSYDRISGQLWVGQNGQDTWEQVYLIQKGGNYGWSLTEGSHVFYAQRQAGPDPILPPTAEHNHSEFRSLTGGRVYRGTSAPDLVGAYVYGDWSTGRVWGVKHDGSKVVWNKELVDTPFNVTGFGYDHAEEMYVIDHVSGFYKLVPTTEADRPTRPFPTRLSDSGLFSSVADHTPHAAAIPFDVNTPQWADGATMERFASFPGMERILQKPQLNAGGAWTLPEGSVTIQTLSLDVMGEDGKPSRRRVETRLMLRQQGEWQGYSYKWNDEQTDATLVQGSGDAEFHEVPDPTAPGARRELAWRFPSRTECMVCHSRASGFVLGFSPLQLDRDHDFNGVVDNQLRAYEHIGLFEGKLPQRSEGRQRLVNPYDEKAPVDARVRSYLHVNCSICHVPEGGGNAKMDLAFGSSLSRMRVVDVPPVHATFDLPDARLIAAGAPERSVLLHRMSIRGTNQMPPLVSTEVDRQTVKLIADWIRGISSEKE
ncbi:MAG: PQQ-dependent sugar dehydrogenase [Isosphaeraceae bacterium]